MPHIVNFCFQCQGQDVGFPLDVERGLEAKRLFRVYRISNFDKPYLCLNQFLLVSARPTSSVTNTFNVRIITPTNRDEHD